MSSEETKTLTGKCYCEKVHFTLDVPKSSLPLRTHICHCDICRQAHGALCVFLADIPHGVEPNFIAPSSFNNLTRHQVANSKGARFFCNTCGCHIGYRSSSDGHWTLSTAIYDANQDESASIWDISEHIHADIQAGGLFSWLPEIDGKKIITTTGKGDDSSPETELADASVTARATQTPPPPPPPDRLVAQCHCGGVSYIIKRPTAEMQNDPIYKLYLSPDDPNKWKSVMDLCGDCRLHSGVQAVPWAYVPQSCIETLPDDLRTGTTQTHASSKGTLRAFCGTCGATTVAFFNAGGARELSNGDKIFNIPVGILRSPDGPLAENWLTWRTGRIAHEASGVRYDSFLTKGLREGMSSWGIHKHGEARDFNVGR